MFYLASTSLPAICSYPVLCAVDIQVLHDSLSTHRYRLRFFRGAPPGVGGSVGARTAGPRLGSQAGFRTIPHFVSSN